MRCGAAPSGSSEAGELSAPFRRHLHQRSHHLIYQRADGSWPTSPLVFVQSQQEGWEAIINAEVLDKRLKWTSAGNTIHKSL